MENVQLRDPKDDQITNKDESITNKDGDNYLERGEPPINQKIERKEQLQIIAYDKDKPGEPVKSKVSDEDREFSKHNL